MIHLSGIEIGWIGINLVAAILTTVALAEARNDWAVLRKFNGSARGIVVRGAVRRETFRLGSQVALLVTALPAVFSEREVPLSLPVVAIMCVPVLILASTVSDRQMRIALTHKLEADIEAERDTSLRRMEDRLNARADQRAGIVSDKADLLREVADETASQVHDIHEATVDPS